MPYKDPAKRKAYVKRRNQTAEYKAYMKKHSKEHPRQKTTEYVAWQNMRRRTKPTAREHEDYFDRGITVCSRWDVYSNFIADMGPKPSPELTLERRDNNKGYSPENCYWGTRDEQNENQRPRKDSTTGCTGVYIKQGKYAAGIAIEGKNKHLGYFSTLEEAVEARKNAEIALYGRLRQTTQFSTTQKRPQGIVTQLRNNVA